MKKKALTISAVVVLLLVGIILIAVHFATITKVEDFIEVPIFDLAKENTAVVDKVDSYLGHPDLVLTDSGKILAAYPSGHGKGPIIIKESLDNGRTWSDRLTGLPKSWESSQETPIFYKLQLKNGNKKIILTSGCPLWPGQSEYKANGFNCSVSADDGETWSEFTNWYGIEWGKKAGRPAYDCIVAMSSLTQLKENGEFVDKWLGTFHDHDFHNYKSILTFDENENPVWSKPEYLIPNCRKQEVEHQMCELEMLRNPSDDTLILISRVNKKNARSLILFSHDEGKTFSSTHELPYALTGERHKAEVDDSGNVIISFRQVLPEKPSKLSTKKFIGNKWACWVGTFDDLMSYDDFDTTNDKVGKAVINLGVNNDKGGADNGYAGTVFKDGEFILASYGYFAQDATNPFIMSVHFKLSDFNIKL